VALGVARCDFLDADNRNVGAKNNLALLKEYQLYLRIEKGLRPLTCEAYESDLTTFADSLRAAIERS